jgi:c-di-GMP-binding flagellar brake protein YcgR
VVYVIVVIVVLALISFVILRFRGGKDRFPWYAFYSKGRSEGFSFREIGFLKTIAMQNRIEKPQSIFWSTKQLDRCLKPALLKINADEKMSPGYKREMTDRLLELRTKAEFNLPRYRKKIRDTLSLLPRQKLLVKDANYGTFTSWIVEITRKHIVITYPSGQKAAEALVWTGRKVLVYFWRAEDAGYEFETRVIEQITHEEFPLLYITHSSSLQRKQMRKAARVEVGIRAQFSPVEITKTEGGTRASVSKRSYMGKIIDLSGGGCCMLAGRLLKKNDRIKLDFSLTQEKRVVALGVIVGASNTGDERVRKFHIMFVKMDMEARHNVLLFVYNIFGEREEDLRERKRAVAAAARRTGPQPPRDTRARGARPAEPERESTGSEEDPDAPRDEQPAAGRRAGVTAVKTAEADEDEA